MDGNYSFGAGGFKLGDRVEVMTTRQRGILISEAVHLSGCNTYHVLLPNVPNAYVEEKMKIGIYDHLLLRRLEPNEAVFGMSDDLTDDTVYAPKGTDVNAEWIKSAVGDNKEPIPEIDEGVGIEEIAIQPGMEVWHKVYNKEMLVCIIYRDIYSKELEYGLTYMVGNKEISVQARAYSLIPMEQRISLYTGSEAKSGPVFADARFNTGVGVSVEEFVRYGGGMGDEQARAGIRG